MKVIRPIQITPSKILSSSATETYSAWNSASTYDLGARVLYNNRIYESLIASNTNKQPDTNKNDWLDIAPSNKMAMFDSQVNTQTTAISNLNVAVQPNLAFNSLALLNLIGQSVRLKVKDSPTGVIVYDETINLDNSSISVIDWYTYFFEDFDFRTEAVFQNIPPYVNGTAEMIVSNATGNTVAVGSVSIGSLTEIGATQYGLNYGIRDYSIKETDEFGNTTFVQRAFSKRMSPNLMVPNDRLNYVGKILEGLRAIPTTYIAADDVKFTGTVIFGFLKDWNIEIKYPSHSMISIEIDGLI